MAEVYITKTAHFLPGKRVENHEMEDYLGLIDGERSKAKAIVLRNNKIQGRYYALEKGGIETHTNSQMVSLAIRKLFKNGEIEEVDLMSCGTSTPDQLIPSHAVMVHGWLPEMKSIEVVSPSGVCCSGMHALKYAFNAIRSGDKSKAVVAGSERTSALLRNWQFEDEVEHLKELSDNPYIAFEKDFLRWMLSDGAGAFLVENKPTDKGLNLRIDWIDAMSFANQEDTCMYMGADKAPDGSLKGYLDYHPQEIAQDSVMALKQDTKLLSEKIVQLGFNHLSNILKKRNESVDEVDYFLPHLSSFFFEPKIEETLNENNMSIPKEKWFTNLAEVGNVGAGSIFLMIDELYNGNRLKKGEKILVAVPESSRFSYVFAKLTVC